MNIVFASYERHAAHILDLINAAIVNTTALYDYDPHPFSYMRQYFDERKAGNYPILAAESDDGTFLGFATYGVYRHYQGYLYSAENSVYVTPAVQGQGVGTALMMRLEEESVVRGIHTLIAVIDVANAASIALHKKCGFTYAGIIREGGFKFGRWLDLVYYQKIVTPAPSSR